MTRLTLDISTSLDGFVAGPNQTLEQPLGEGGERLHEWAFGLASFRERHGRSGGEINADDQVMKESLRATGVVVMGRRMGSRPPSSSSCGGRRQRCRTGGGASVAQQYLKAGLLDELQIHLVPVLLGGGASTSSSVSASIRFSWRASG